MFDIKLDQFSAESLFFILSTEVSVFVPEKSSRAVAASSLPRPVSMRVLNSVPMGSRGWPTQPSRLVTDVIPLWSSSAETHTQSVNLYLSGQCSPN